MVSSAAYFAKLVLGGPQILSIMLPSLSVAILGGGFLAGILLRRMTIRWANALAGVVTILCYLVLLRLEADPVAFVVLFALANAANGIHSTSLFVMLANSVERHEEMFGARREGLIVSGASFGVKVGMAFGAGIVAFALTLARYNPTAITGTAQAAVRHLFYTAPMLVAVLLIIGFWHYRDDRKAVAP
jgi:GPH family glycoside/pentoside/hexuronide:cation symporter